MALTTFLLAVVGPACMSAAFGFDAEGFRTGMTVAAVACLVEQQGMTLRGG